MAAWARARREGCGSWLTPAAGWNAGRSEACRGTVHHHRRPPGGTPGPAWMRRAGRDQARRERFAGRQASERASAQVARLQRQVSEITSQLLLQGVPAGPIPRTAGGSRHRSRAARGVRCGRTRAGPPGARGPARQPAVPPCARRPRGRTGSGGSSPPVGEHQVRPGCPVREGPDLRGPHRRGHRQAQQVSPGGVAGVGHRAGLDRQVGKADGRDGRVQPAGGAQRAQLAAQFAAFVAD